MKYVNRVPRNILPWVMKHYSPTGRRNRGRPLKRLLDTWDERVKKLPNSMTDMWWWWTKENSSDITAVQVIASETKVQGRKAKLKEIPNPTIQHISWNCKTYKHKLYKKNLESLKLFNKQLKAIFIPTYILFSAQIVITRAGYKFLIT